MKSQNNSTISYNWCISHTVSEINASQDLKDLCADDLREYYKLIGIFIAVSFVVILIKEIMIRVIYLLGRLQKYHSYNEYHSWLLVGLFLVNVTTTMFITVMVQADINGVSIKRIMTLFTSDPTILLNIDKTISYDDITRGWYFDTGYKLTVNTFILSLFPLISQPLFIIFNQLYTKYKASKEVIQYKLNKTLGPLHFTFER